jgi:prophage regulatory protein
MRFLVFADLPSKGIDYSRQHLKRVVAEGKFPAPVKGVCRENAWPEPVIDRYVEDRVAAARAPETAAA